jgi:hypothetical protein
MAVGEDGQIGFPQIDPQDARVLQEGVILSGIEEKVPPAGLNPDGEPEPVPEIRAARGILHQRREVHGESSVLPPDKR